MNGIHRGVIPAAATGAFTQAIGSTGTSGCGCGRTSRGADGMHRPALPLVVPVLQQMAVPGGPDRSHGAMGGRLLRHPVHHVHRLPRISPSLRCGLSHTRHPHSKRSIYERLHRRGDRQWRDAASYLQRSGTMATSGKANAQETGGRQGPAVPWSSLPALL